MSEISNSAGPLESQVDYLFLLFTDVDIRSRESFDAWRLSLGPASQELTWQERFAEDPDQRTGEAPQWGYLAIAGASGAPEKVYSLLAELTASRPGAQDYVAWVYEAAGPFVRKSDGLPGSPSKASLAPGAYRTSEETENRR